MPLLFRNASTVVEAVGNSSPPSSSASPDVSLTGFAGVAGGTVAEVVGVHEVETGVVDEAAGEMGAAGAGDEIGAGEEIETGAVGMTGAGVTGAGTSTTDAGCGLMSKRAAISGRAFLARFSAATPCAFGLSGSMRCARSRRMSSTWREMSSMPMPSHFCTAMCSALLPSASVRCSR